ncbi:MAG: PilZ domain-containing protein [Gammaproteobacteria bacterium]|nr:PilZ domain-containing protein [Gammaproteobacteria bacterium]
MTNEPAERRSNPRIDINGSITYRTDISDDVCQGKLENMSRQGARIWIDQELPTASRLRVRVETHENNQEAMEFKATLIYTLPGGGQALYGYGCTIEETGQSDK